MSNQERSKKEVRPSIFSLCKTSPEPPIWQQSEDSTWISIIPFFNNSRRHGSADTVFGTCQSVGQAADGEWADARLAGKMKGIGLLSQDGHSS